MEFKRACCLPFSAIGKLLEPLQLLCPPNNTLLRTLYAVKKFFRNISSNKSKQIFCADCDLELEDGQKGCVKTTCCKMEPSILLKLDSMKGIQRVLASEYKLQ